MLVESDNMPFCLNFHVDLQKGYNGLFIKHLKEKYSDKDWQGKLDRAKAKLSRNSLPL